MPEISVLMSAYNAAEYLQESVESIINQSFSDFEFLIVDDASTDDTGRILESYAHNDPRIRLFTNQPNQGLTQSLNMLLEKAQGAYIARHDADDISYPRRLEKQMAVFKKNPQVELVFTSSKILSDSGAFVCHEWRPKKLNRILELLPLINYIPHSSVLFKKDLIHQHGMYNPGYRRAQDMELWIRYRDRGVNFYYLDEELIGYRMNPNSVTSENFTKAFNAYYYADLCLIHRQKRRALTYLSQLKGAEKIKLLLKTLEPSRFRFMRNLHKRRRR